MFRSLGLFNPSRCPDNSCHRPNCFFNHGEPSRPTPTPPAPAYTQKPMKRKYESESSLSAKRVDIPSGIRAPTPSPTRTPSGEPKNGKLTEIKGKGTPAAAVVNSRVTPKTVAQSSVSLAVSSARCTGHNVAHSQCISDLDHPRQPNQFKLPRRIPSIHPIYRPTSRTLHNHGRIGKKLVGGIL